MKIYNPIKLLAILSIVMFSCSDEDNVTQTLSSSDIVGSWSLVAINSTPAVDLEENGNSDPNVMNQTGCFDGMSLDFDNNGNVTAISSEINYNANASPSFSCSLRTDSGSYLLNNNDLTVSITLDGSQETETLNVNI
ncbi:MAG: lipocalin family protein [Psychroflexus sp.]|nr:lipocalin family protein [Psychroflexus sp.]MDR9448984.1 lipocalin family protein [Psychroflexus sp.]